MIPDPEPPFGFRPGKDDSPIIVLADHARNRLPPGYGDLGVSQADLERHIAFDPGTEWLALKMSELLGAHLVFTNFSRLLVDANRGQNDPTLIVRVSDGTPIIGNRGLSPEERAYRIKTYHEPYHAAIARCSAQIVESGRFPVFLSVHSFTRIYRRRERPWQAGLLFGDDRRISDVFFRAFSRARPQWNVGLNEPYRGNLSGDTISRHALRYGYSNTTLEVCNDFMRERDAVEQLASDLVQEVREALLEDTVTQPWVAAGEGAQAPEEVLIGDRALTMAIESSVFRRLIEHLRGRHDVENIDLMNLSGFCRNCLSRWYCEAAHQAGVEIDREAARRRVYGMDYGKWKELYQKGPKVTVPDA